MLNRILGGKTSNGAAEAPFQPSLYLPGELENEEVAADKARKIARCSDLLRKKYELDVGILGCREADVAEKGRLQQRSAALLREVQRSVQQLKFNPKMRWTMNEWRMLEEICEKVGA